MIHITQEAIIQKKCRYCSDFPLHWVCESQACGVGAHGLEGRLPHHGGLKGEGEHGELSWGKHWCIGEPLFNGPIKHCHTTFYAATLCYAEADQILSFWILTWSGDLNTWKDSIVSGETGWDDLVTKKNHQGTLCLWCFQYCPFWWQGGKWGLVREALLL